MGAIHTTVKHDMYGDAVAIAPVDVGTAGVPCRGPKREFWALQPRADTKLEVGVGLTGKNQHQYGSFTCGHMSSYQREVLLRLSSSLGRTD